MSTQSSIEWTEATWNPVTGCTKISEGCKHCYAERMATRLQAMGVEKYRNGFDLTLHESALEEPLRWKKPRIVFVNSMSDLFHEAVPAAFIESVFRVMNRASQHTFQVLTKRPARVMQLDHGLTWTPNIWLGTSIESKEWLDRLAKLKESNALTKFLSLEPLLGPLPGLDLTGIDWVIVGRRIRTRCPAHEGGLGEGNTRQLPAKRRPVFLQAVGRRVQETDGSRA